MMEAVITGLFTGIGVYVANWASKKYLEHRLEKTDNRIRGAINFVKRGFKNDRHTLQGEKKA